MAPQVHGVAGTPHGEVCNTRLSNICFFAGVKPYIFTIRVDVHDGECK